MQYITFFFQKTLHFSILRLRQGGIGRELYRRILNENTNKCSSSDFNVLKIGKITA